MLKNKKLFFIYSLNKDNIFKEIITINFENE